MVKIVFDPESLTMGELCDYEDITGMTIDRLGSGVVTTRMLLAMVYITRRREDPSYTLEDAKRVRLMDIEAVTDPPQPALEPMRPAPDGTDGSGAPA